MKSSQVVRGLAVTLLVGLAVFLVVDDGKHDSAAIALAALALASFLAFIDPATLFADLTEFQVGPLAGKISRDARTAAEQTASEEPDKQAGEIAEPLEKTLLALRLRLEAKLAYLAKHQLVGTGAATFLTIGSLHHDGGLTDEQAETATRVLTLRDDELAHLPNVERDAFLEAARKLVSNIRASVHYNLTYQALKEQEKERSWSITEVKHKESPRPFFQVETPERRTFRVAAIHALADDSENLSKARERLAETASKPPHARSRVIVVPDNSRVGATGREGDPRILHLRDLKTALADAQFGRAESN